MSLEEIRTLIEKARRNIRSAKLLLEAGHNDIAVSRAYFAMFYAASAVLLALGERRSKHAAVVAAFGQCVTKPGLLPPARHRALVDAFEDCRLGDYGHVFQPRETVEARIGDAAEFVADVATFLASRGIDVGEEPK